MALCQSKATLPIVHIKTWVSYFFLTRLLTYIIHQGFCTFHVYYNNITTQQKSTQDIGHTLQYRSAATVPNESCPMRVIVYLSKHCSSAMVFGFRQYIHEIRKCSNHHTVFEYYSFNLNVPIIFNWWFVERHFESKSNFRLSKC